MYRKITILSIFTILMIAGLYSPLSSNKVSAALCSATIDDASCTCPNPTDIKNRVGSGYGCLTRQDVADAQLGTDISGALNQLTCSIGLCWLNPVNWIPIALRTVMALIPQLVSLILSIVALVFDKILEYTIVDVAKNLGGAQGIGGAINDAWKTLRDLANMAFIFVLIWAAIQTMLDLNATRYKTQIKNIIIVALLINFSLFFTQVVIDAGNIATLGFYNAIMANSTSLSAIFMKALGLQSWSGPALLDTLKTGPQANMLLFLTSVLGAVTMLIFAVILIIASVMFIARFIILIFVLILSPIAFISYAIPGMQKHATEWKDALVNQSFFPLYFMLLTWIAIKIIASPNFIPTTGKEWSIAASLPQETVGLFLKFAMIIGFLVGALILAKKAANSTTKLANINKWTGAAVVGGVAAGLRNTVGRHYNDVYNDPELRRKAAEGDVKARMRLATAEKLSKSSFDLRGAAGSKVGKAIGADKHIGDVIGKAGGTGGFAKSIKEKEDRLAKIAKERYGQTGAEKDDITEKKKVSESMATTEKEAEENYEKQRKEEETVIKEKRKKEAENIGVEVTKAEEELAAKKKEAEESKKIKMSLGISETDAEEAVKKITEEAEEKLKQTKIKHTEAVAKAKAQVEFEEYSENIKNLRQETEYIRDDARTVREAWEKSRDAAQNRQHSFAERIEKGPLNIGFIGQMQGNKNAARKIREQAKGKSNAEQAADLLKKIKEEEDKNNQNQNTPPAPAPTPPPTPPITP